MNQEKIVDTVILETLEVEKSGVKGVMSSRTKKTKRKRPMSSSKFVNPIEIDENVRLELKQIELDRIENERILGLSPHDWLLYQKESWK
jgi:hypothetical protein